MFDSLRNAVLEWNRSTDDRQKLQHSYIVVAIVSLLAAGLVSLVDSETGQDLLLIPLAAAIFFITNAVLWSLVESGLVARLTNRRKR